MIGWAAVTGDVSLGSIVLFAMIFMWTPPHFWALALYKSDEYARAGVPMLPVVSGAAETKRQILVYTLSLVPVTLVPWLIGLASWIYGAAAAALGLLFIVGAIQVARGQPRAPQRLFAFSILYLFLLFALLLVDGLLPWHG
jgi:protoheme IX farnesyltransferase